MASNIALGVVIGGAVGASFGRAISDSSAKIAAFKDKAERLGAEQVRLGAALELRGLNLRRYADLRRETKAIEDQWKTSSAKVAELGKRLAEARRTASTADGNGLVNRLALEAEALKKQAAATSADWKKKQQQAKAYQDMLASGSGKPDGEQKARLVALKAEGDALKKKAAEEIAALKRKNEELKAAKQAANEARAAEAALSAEFDKAKNAAAASKREFAAKREEAHKLQQTLRATSKEAAATAEQMKRLEKAAKGLQLGATGRARIGEAWQQTKDNAGLGMAVGAAVAAPTMISANYQATIRDIAIKGGFSNTQQEKDTSERIIGASQATGINKNDLAAAINTLVSGGMDAKEAVNYSDLIGKFSIGQGASGEETAAMINALSQNAQIKTPEQMDKALNAIAYLGKAGSFESKDMAKWFPSMLTEMQKLGITGQGSVTQLGAMLQVARKTAGTSDEAANNLKNWFSKIGSDETKKNYAKAGINYEEEIKTAIGNGMTSFEASFELAKRYIERADPGKAKEIQDMAAKIEQETDEGRKKQMLQSFAETMKTGDLFNDMQVKAALTAYMQNADLYRKLRDDSAKATKDLDQGLIERRENSKQKWSEVGNAVDLAMTRIGDAIRPATDWLAEKAIVVGNAIAWTAEKFPGLIGGIAALGTAAVAVGAVMLTGKAAVGVFEMLRGAWLARGADKLLPTVDGKGGKPGGVAGAAIDAMTGGAAVQRVFVVNMPGGGLGGGADLPGGKPGGKPATGKPQGRWAALKSGAGNLLGKVAPVAGKVGGGLAVAGAAYSAVDTFRNAKTDQEKAEGYGGAAGGLAGGLAGAKVGAVVGAMAGPVGVAIGGIAGGVLGSILGDKAGSWMGGKAIARTVPPAPVVNTKFAVPPAPTLAPAPVVAPAPAAAPTAPTAPRQPPQQNLTFSPTIQVKVQGDVKDPRQLASELMPHLKRMFEQLQATTARSALYDGAPI